MSLRVFRVYGLERQRRTSLLYGSMEMGAIRVSTIHSLHHLCGLLESYRWQFNEMAKGLRKEGGGVALLVHQNQNTCTDSSPEYTVAHCVSREYTVASCFLFFFSVSPTRVWESDLALLGLDPAVKDDGTKDFSWWGLVGSLRTDGCGVSVMWLSESVLLN